jgi:hypothetical protein
MTMTEVTYDSCRAGSDITCCAKREAACRRLAITFAITTPVPCKAAFLILFLLAWLFYDASTSTRRERAAYAATVGSSRKDSATFWMPWR